MTIVKHHHLLIIVTKNIANPSRYIIEGSKICWRFSLYQRFNLVLLKILRTLLDFILSSQNHFWQLNSHHHTHLINFNNNQLLNWDFDLLGQLVSLLQIYIIFPYIFSQLKSHDSIFLFLYCRRSVGKKFYMFSKIPATHGTLQIKSNNFRGWLMFLSRSFAMKGQN
jgi:hypothetical protein